MISSAQVDGEVDDLDDDVEGILVSLIIMTPVVVVVVMGVVVVAVHNMMTLVLVSWF